MRPMMGHLGKVAIGVLGALAVLAGTASAQLTTGTISGVVRDSSDAVVPGATVTVMNQGTGLNRVLVSDAQGRYRGIGLGPGAYHVQAELPGFQTEVRQGITLAAGQDAVVNFKLQVSSTKEEIIVTGEAPLIETTTATVSGLVTPEQMEAIPLNARSFLELVPLTAGAVMSDAGAQSSAQGFGKKISIAGARYISNLFLLDGAVMNDFYGAAGSAAGTVAGVETVREFRVITNAFDAEYGRHTGGVISAVTKSGTNVFHGSVFEFLRNDALDAENFFDRGAKPPYQRNQFGGSIGGRLRTDRTFFFGSYEGLRETLGLTKTFNVPGQRMRQGFIGTQNIGVAANVKPFLDSFPAPTTPDRADGTAQTIMSMNQVTYQNFWTVRIDQNLSGADSLFARMTVDNAQRDIPALGGINTKEVDSTPNRFFTAQGTHIFSPQLLSRTNFSLTRTQNDAADVPVDGFTFPLVSFAGNDVPGRISVSGLSMWGGGQFNPKSYQQTLFQFSEDLTYSLGGHSLRFGFRGERMHYDMRSDVNGGGVYYFTSLADFMRGVVNRVNFVEPGSSNVRNWRQNLFGLYFQDDISVRPGLTVNLGLRYEFITTPKETNGKVATIRDLTAPHIYTVRPDQTDVGDPYFVNPSLKNFEPRVGVAWSPFASGRTSVRSGFGIFHEQILPNYFVLAGVRAAPFYSIAEVNSRDVRVDFPDSYTTQVLKGVTGGAKPQIDGWQYDPAQPRVMKWSVDVQQEIGQKMSVTAGYMGSLGRNLMRGSLQYNTTPSELRNGRRYILIEEPVPNPYWSRMRFPQFDGTTDYHSMQLRVDKRFVAGLQVGFGYTLSKAMDDSTTVQGGADNGLADREVYRTLAEHGPAAYDVRQSCYTNFVLDLPGRDFTGAKGALLGGWGIAGLVRLTSGYPLSLTADRRRLGTLQMQYVGGPSVDLIPGGNPNPVNPQNPNQYFDVTQFAFPESFYLGNVGRNTLTGPGIATVDMTLTKDTRVPALGPDSSVQLRLEVFNLLNRANFGPPAVNLFTTTGARYSTAGVITTTSTPSRQVQLALKFLF